MMALNRSATRVMPKGAGQPPAWVVQMPWRQTKASSARPATSRATAPATARTRCSAVRRQASSETAAVVSGISRGKHQQHVAHRSLTFRSSGSSLPKV